MVLLMRHSAREFNRDVHDLVNPLTEEGRAMAHRLGEQLPKTLTVRGYASPPERCMETAALILAAHTAFGGRSLRCRAVEALGVFYALDQAKMWMAMNAAGGLSDYVLLWADGGVPVDAMMPASVAADMVLRTLYGKLANPPGDPALDVCVSHDMTLYLMKHQLLAQSPATERVDFLDAVALYREPDTAQLMLASDPARRCAVPVPSMTGDENV